MATIFETIRQDIKNKLATVRDKQALQNLKVEYLGKKGAVSGLMKEMKNLSNEEKPAFGQLVNELRNEVLTLIEGQEKTLSQQMLNAQLAAETLDVTLPAKNINLGSAHPLSHIIEDLEDLFISMGYTVAEGPEVESDYYNFEMLNLPKGHPAREMQDSFYITEETLLRTHTSSIQARTMVAAKGQAPIKIICPGIVYRRDSDDATHSHQFMQIEGLVIDENISMSDLKGTLLVFAKKMFGDNREIRLRPSFFPFTEPSVEVDISCFKCGGEGCNVCKHTGWIEVLGAGMVHPNVLTMAGFDATKYQGFAFGMGVDRIAMLKYGIEDIRHFYVDDLRFLEQFKALED